jgi:hypothetical protein
MALTKIEYDLLEKAAASAEKAATTSSNNGVLLAEHGHQLTDLFTRISAVENSNTVIKTKQDDCPARKDFEGLIAPGNRSERKGIVISYLTAGIAVIALLWDKIIAGLIK